MEKDKYKRVNQSHWTCPWSACLQEWCPILPLPDPDLLFVPQVDEAPADPVVVSLLWRDFVNDHMGRFVLRMKAASQTSD